jgi:competence protein ComEC
VRSPLGWAHHLPCHRGERWQWQGLNFRLWPLPGSTAKGTITPAWWIDDGRSSILLTGDIERQAEQAMISRYWQHLTSTHSGSPPRQQYLLQQLLVRGVDGAAALAPLRATMRGGSRTRWFSATASGYRWFATPQGQITVVFSQKGGKSIAYGIKFYRVGIISGLARPPITGRICGYFNTSWFIECRTIKISPRGRPSADFGRLLHRLKPG